MRIKKELDQQTAENLQKVPVEFRCLVISITSIALSLLIQVAEYQLLTLALITGAKWVTETKNNRIIIIERSPKW